MESIPVEFTKNPSDDIFIVEKEEIKGVGEEVPHFFEVGDGKISVVEEVITSVESLETISPHRVREEDNDDQGIKEQSNTLMTIKRVYFQQEPLSTDFIRKVWTAFLTFHVFVIPAIIGMILSVANRYPNSDNDPYQEIMYSVMIGFLGSSVLVGLPFHMLALADLEETVNDVMLHAQIEHARRNDCEGSVDSDSDDEADVLPFF